MKSLLVVAHGSRRDESNTEVRDLANRLGRQATDYDTVSSAFLEIAEPSIPDGLRAVIRAGATEVVVLPYFLSAGRHVVSDIPAAVDVVRAEYPQVKIRLAPYLGAAEELVDVLLRQAGT